LSKLCGNGPVINIITNKCISYIIGILYYICCLFQINKYQKSYYRFKYGINNYLLYHQNHQVGASYIDIIGISHTAAKKVVSLFSHFFFQAVITVFCSSRENGSNCILLYRTSFIVLCYYQFRGNYKKKLWELGKKNVWKQRYDLLRFGGRYNSFQVFRTVNKCS